MKQLKVTEWSKASLLFSDVRLALIEHCRRTPHSIKELAQVMELNPGTIFNHIRKLHEAGLLEVVQTRQVRGIEEKKYAPTADHFDLSELAPEDLPKRNEKIAQDVKKKVKHLLTHAERPSIKHMSAYLMEEDLEYIREELERLREFAHERRRKNTAGAQKCTFLYALGGIEEDE